MKGIIWSLVLLASGPAFAQGQLTVLINPSYLYLDWESPKNLLSTFVRANIRKLVGETGHREVRKFAMGHAVIQLQCKDRDGVTHDFWTGISGQNNIAVDKTNIFDKKLGVRVMFESYDDGYIQDTNKVEGFLKHFRGRMYWDRQGKWSKQTPRFLRFPISEDQCSELYAFYQTFKRLSFKEPKSPSELEKTSARDKLWFGFMLDPYEQYKQIRGTSLSDLPLDYKYGGGCTSFMTAFVKVGGLFDPLFENTWTRELTYTKHLFGGLDEDTGEVRKVDIFEVMGPLGEQWTIDGMQAHTLKIYDPELIWRSFDNILGCTEYPETCTQEEQDYLSQQGKSTADFIEVTEIRERWITLPSGHRKKTNVKEVIKIPGLRFEAATKP